MGETGEQDFALALRSCQKTHLGMCEAKKSVHCCYFHGCFTCNTRHS